MKFSLSSFSLWDLFVHFFRVSLFTLGGGFSMLMVLERFYVREREYLSKENWEECVIVAQASPGAFAVNLAYLIGFHLKGLAGALSAVVGVVLPAFLSMLVAGSLMIRFLEVWYMRSFLVGVACGPVAYYTFILLRIAQGVFKNLWMVLAFVFYTTLMLFFDVSVFRVIMMAIALIVMKILCFFGRRRNSSAKEGKPEEEV